MGMDDEPANKCLYRWRGGVSFKDVSSPHGKHQTDLLWVVYKEYSEGSLVCGPLGVYGPPLQSLAPFGSCLLWVLGLVLLVIGP